MPVKKWTAKKYDKNWISFRSPFVFAIHYLITERPAFLQTDENAFGSQWKLDDDLMLVIKFNETKEKKRNRTVKMHSNECWMDTWFSKSKLKQVFEWLRLLFFIWRKSIEVFNLQAKQRQKLIMISRIKYSTSNSLPFNLRNYSRHSIEYW